MEFGEQESFNLTLEELGASITQSHWYLSDSSSEWDNSFPLAENLSFETNRTTLHIL